MKDNSMKTIRVAKLRDEARIPSRKHPDDAGMDFYAAADWLIAPHSFETIPTGITIEIPRGYVGLARLKSRSNYMLAAGVVDAGYQGEIMVKILNPTDFPILIHAGDAIAQMLILPIETPQVQEMPLDQIHTERSARGATGGILGNSED